jgi:hypothetical protein
MIRGIEEDFVGWADDTAKAIEEGRFDEIDRTALADEVASLSRSAKRELTSALRLLLVHMLKAQYQPEKHTRSWDDTMRRERRNAKKFLAESPSLKSSLNEIFADAYEDAIYQAESETLLALSTFPKSCQWTIEEVLLPS